MNRCAGRREVIAKHFRDLPVTKRDRPEICLSLRAVLDNDILSESSFFGSSSLPASAVRFD